MGFEIDFAGKVSTPAPLSVASPTWTGCGSEGHDPDQAADCRFNFNCRLLWLLEVTADLGVDCLRAPPRLEPVSVSPSWFPHEARA